MIIPRPTYRDASNHDKQYLKAETILEFSIRLLVAKSRRLNNLLITYASHDLNKVYKTPIDED